MDQNALEKLGIDFENGIGRFAGSEALYGKYLLRFLEDGHYRAGVCAMQRNEYAAMFDAMHALKSVSGTLGMTELFDCCAAVTTAIRAGKTGGIEELMAQAGEVHDRLYAGLSALRAAGGLV